MQVTVRYREVTERVATIDVPSQYDVERITAALVNESDDYALVNEERSGDITIMLVKAEA